MKQKLWYVHFSFGWLQCSVWEFSFVRRLTHVSFFAKIQTWCVCFRYLVYLGCGNRSDSRHNVPLHDDALGLCYPSMKMMTMTTRHLLVVGYPPHEKSRHESAQRQIRNRHHSHKPANKRSRSSSSNKNIRTRTRLPLTLVYIPWGCIWSPFITPRQLYLLLHHLLLLLHRQRRILILRRERDVVFNNFPTEDPRIPGWHDRNSALRLVM